MKVIIPVVDGNPEWDKPRVDLENDYDERRPTEEELKFLRAQVEREEEYDKVCIVD